MGLDFRGIRNLVRNLTPYNHKVANFEVLNFQNQITQH